MRLCVNGEIELGHVSGFGARSGHLSREIEFKEIASAVLLSSLQMKW